MTETYYYGQGRVFVAAWENGVAPVFRWAGDVSSFSVKMGVEKVEHSESYSGTNSLVVSFPKKKTCSVTGTFFNISSKNIGLTLYGKVVSKNGGTVTEEELPLNIGKGSIVTLKNFGITGEVILTDSSSSPVTIGKENYAVSPHGSIEFYSLPGSITPPLKAAYSFTESSGVGLFTAPQPTIVLRYEGVNLAKNNEPVLVELYKVPTDPLQEFAFITDGNDVAGMGIEGSVLLDSSRPFDSEFGQFGRIVQLGA